MTVINFSLAYVGDIFIILVNLIIQVIARFVWCRVLTVRSFFIRISEIKK